MTSFKTRLLQAAKKKEHTVFACDFGYDRIDHALDAIEYLSSRICAVKLNFHLLLPLGAEHISQITEAAHSLGLQCIADIKLNDIDSTNEAAAGVLCDMGFDALIANPIMGKSNMKKLTRTLHGRDCGIISLCHMSASSAAATYELPVTSDDRPTALYRVFLDIAAACSVDGIIVGATYPGVIKFCKDRHPDLVVLSPGVGAQGGVAQDALSAGANYLIAGRSLIDSFEKKA